TAGVPCLAKVFGSDESMPSGSRNGTKGVQRADFNFGGERQESDRQNVECPMSKAEFRNSIFGVRHWTFGVGSWRRSTLPPPREGDRKSTRLNSSHDQISYAVFCLKKKKI